MSAWKSICPLALIGVLCVMGSCSCQPAPLPEALELPELPYADKLQQAIDQVLLAEEADRQLGISAAVIAPGYRPWIGVSGTSHADVKITPDMLFDAGSVEKNLEAALVLKLVEEGLLALDDPVSQYLPAYPHVDGTITVRQLLDHTSGIFNVFEHPDFPWVGAGVDYSRSWKLEEVFNTFVLEPYGPPGQAQHYSSTNYLLVTAIIEQVTGSSVSEEIDRRLLRPMALEYTYVSMGEQPPEAYKVAHPWADVDGDGALEDLSGMPLTWKVTLTHPALFSTASDLAQWMHALYHEQTVLDPDSLKEMLAYPEVTRRDPEGGVYGLGVVDFTDRLGVPVLGHGGSSLGYSAAALYLPQSGNSVAWLINTGESPRELADRLMSHVWSSLLAVLRSP